MRSHLETDLTSLKPACIVPLSARLVDLPRFKMPLLSPREKVLLAVEWAGVAASRASRAFCLATLSMAVLSASMTS